MRRRAIPLLSILLIFAGSSATLAPRADAADDRRITLRPAAAKFSFAKGHAKYRDRGGEQEFQVEVENLHRFAGATFTVQVNGVVVGRMPINVLGRGRLSRNSDLGQRVPVITPGSTVRIRKPNGVTILFGRF